MNARICVGEVTAAHGVRGAVRLRSFTSNPADLAAYGPLSDETGTQRFSIRLLSWNKDHWLARVEGVEDRTAAETLRGVKLYVERALLPAPEEEEFYHADLIGLPAETPDGAPFGTIVAVYEFGGGDVLEIRSSHGATTMIPFTRLAIPLVDIAGRRVVVDPPVMVEDASLVGTEATPSSEATP
ncbi:Ribosome maturation factor RimM [Azospirillaceae bacterium]